MMLNKIRHNNQPRKVRLFCLSGLSVFILLFIQSLEPLRAQEKKTTAENPQQRSAEGRRDEKPLVSMEQVPEFPGGQEGLMNYLSSNIRYPQSAEKANIQGRVVLQFVVKKDGTVGDVKVEHSVSPELDQEAVRVVQAMPKWKPGRQNHEAVNVFYMLPITFSLPSDGGRK